MSSWVDIPAPPIGSPRGSTTMLLTVGAPRRELAYLNAAARHAFGDPAHVRWQQDADGRVAIVRADFGGEPNGGRRYAVSPRGQVTCTPILAMLGDTVLPVTFTLARDGERLVVTGKVKR